ncbi:PKD-like family lipoprotein [Sphingobacterium tabacisoli]|uniref:PKD-like family lipoprotein n=1 Tax=Sphingobacterium tabacisoli TaxID=2044855 RepID=A0ABW5L6J1_9SPHI|nr:PKD-like family lipoprotein [Sphingobacterium tabacisoli]
MNIYKYIIALSSVGAMLSCSKDLGNYEYQKINELVITDIANNYSAISSFDTLQIVPKVTMTEEVTDSDRLQYIWVIKDGTTVIDTAGREEKLNYPIALPPKNYTIQLRIEDKQTKVTWTKKANLTVGTAYSRGLLLMGEDQEGNAELDFISMVRDTIVVHDILKSNGLPKLNGPLLAQHTGGNEATIKMWVSTLTGAYYLNRVNMAGNPANSFGKLLYLTDNINKNNEFPIIIAPQIINAGGGIGNAYNRAVLTSTGNIYANSLFGAPDFYANPVNRHKDNFSTLIKSAPYLFYSISNLNSLLWYDSTKDRFMNFTSLGFNLTSDILPDGENDPFPWNQTVSGRKLIYGENSRNTDGGSTLGNSFAIMKDGYNNCFIYKFYANGATPSKRNAYNVKSIAIDFDKADHYAFSSHRTVVFYSVGNKLYAYDYNPNNEKLYEFPVIGNDPITLLKFDTQIDFVTNSLYVATYNQNTKGTLRRFTINNDPNTIEIQAINNARWNGLVKIKTINWRAVN